MELPKKLLRVVDGLGKLPGIGDKTALRLSLILSSWKQEDLVDLGQAVTELATLRYCNKCGLFANQDLCDICASPRRADSKIVCIVETITDCMAIERSGQFLGRYHILGGVLNPLMGIGPDDLKIDQMVLRFKEEAVEEIILAINPSVEGDATCSYIRQQVGEEIRVQRIGFGVPIGGSLEYLDSMTISKALENRKVMS